MLFVDPVATACTALATRAPPCAGTAALQEAIIALLCQILHSVVTTLAPVAGCAMARFPLPSCHLYMHASPPADDEGSQRANPKHYHQAGLCQLQDLQVLCRVRGPWSCRCPVSRVGTACYLSVFFTARRIHLLCVADCASLELSDHGFSELVVVRRRTSFPWRTARVARGS